MANLKPESPFLESAAQYGIPPELFEALAGGARAKQQMNLLTPQYRQAQDNASAQLPGVQGQGLAATAPNLAQAIATLAQQYQGRKQMANLEAQAKALGEQISSADVARLGLELRQKPQSQVGRYRPTDQGTLDTSTGITDPSTAKVRETPEEKRRRDIKFAVDRALAVEEARASRGTTPKKDVKPTGGETKEFREAGRLLSTLDELQGMRGTFDAGQLAELDNPYISMVTDVLPQSGQRRMEDFAYSAPVRKYLTKLSGVESDLSKLAAGLSVTGFEMNDRQRWSPNAPGISDEERQNRIQNIRERLFGQRQSYTDTYSNTPGPVSNQQDDRAIYRQKRLEYLRSKQ